jgi:two-component sensor histidine kinase/CheY-like chemotaxis protein
LLLAREVDHRARNALAVVQSIVRLTRARSVQDYVHAVEGRIRALARAHNLLSESRWQGADLARLVQEELAPFKRGSEEHATAGPAIALPPTMAQTLALALHELATNAAKYGALSAKAGQVAVRWKLAGGRLVLEWVESAGPEIEAPSTQGFGMKVIAASIERQLGGAVHYDWCSEGLRCTLSVPYDHEQPEAAAPEPAQESIAVAPSGFGIARQVLLVEDEALVGMMMRDVLTEMGLSVLGPFGTASEALSAANQQDFDCAILDVNVGGEFVYPVADVLVARDVPFIFLTGYDADGIESRFAHVPSVRKPVQREMLQGMFSATLPRKSMGRRRASLG